MNLDDDLQSFESRLGELAPHSKPLNPESFYFRVGQESVLRQRDIAKRTWQWLTIGATCAAMMIGAFSMAKNSRLAREIAALQKANIPQSVDRRPTTIDVDVFAAMIEKLEELKRPSSRRFQPNGLFAEMEVRVPVESDAVPATVAESSVIKLRRELELF